MGGGSSVAVHCRPSDVSAVLRSGLIALAVLGALPAAADFDEDVLAQSHVAVNGYSGSNLERMGTGVVIGPETVLADALVVGRGDRFTVATTSGAELAATVTQSDPETSLAVLSVAGLEAPAVTLAAQEISEDEDRFVFGAVTNPTAGGPGAAFQFPMGSVSRIAEFEPRGGREDPLSLYEHNARITAGGFGGSLLNNCGELVGLNRPSPDAGGWFADALRDPDGLAYASRLTAIEEQLDQWRIEYRKATDDCLSEAEAAAQQAEQRRLEAEQRAMEAEQAQAELEEARLREQELAEAAQAAREAGDESRAEAERAQREAEEAAAAVAEAEARRAEAEEAAEAARQAAEAESRALEEELEQARAAATRATEEQERLRAESTRNLLIASAVGAALLILAVGFFVVRSRRKNRQIEIERARAKKAADELDAAKRHGEFPDCLFEGADDKNARVALKIPGSSLGTAVEGVVIGRSPGSATFVIDSPSVSRVHCRLKVDRGSLYISDLGSTNGVVLNGVRLTAEDSRLLRPGDRLILGEVDLTFRYL